MFVTAGTGPGRSQEPRTHSRSPTKSLEPILDLPHGWQRFRYLGRLLQPPRAHRSRHCFGSRGRDSCTACWCPRQWLNHCSESLPWETQLLTVTYGFHSQLSWVSFLNWLLRLYYASAAEKVFVHVCVMCVILVLLILPICYLVYFPTNYHQSSQLDVEVLICEAIH